MPHVRHENRYVYVVDVGFSNKVLGPGEFSVLENHKETDQFVCLGFVSWSSLIFFSIHFKEDCVCV